MARFVALLALLLTLLVPLSALARTPWSRTSDSTEERALDTGYEGDGAFLAPCLGAGHREPAFGRSATWLRVTGFSGATARGPAEVGFVVAIGFPFDGAARHSGESARRRPSAALLMEPGGPEPSGKQPPTAILPVTPRVARAAVRAGLRAAGVAIDDARIDAILGRARLSALLPETRLRVMKANGDQVRVDTYTDEQRGYDTVRSTLWLEARLTFRLDRLLYADDEPQLERLRADAHDSRAKIGAKVLEALFRWQRAFSDTRLSVPGSRDAFEAALRQAEAEAVLSVLTGGWFDRWRASMAPAPPLDAEPQRP